MSGVELKSINDTGTAGWFAGYWKVTCLMSLGQ